MEALSVIFSALAVQVATVFSVIGMVLALLKAPKNSALRRKCIWTAGASAFVVVAIWLLQQQSNVLAGGAAPTTEQPVAIATKGVVKYVSQDQAHLYNAGMWVLIVLVLIFAVIHKIAGTADEA
jgi:hypothetical protein